MKRCEAMLEKIDGMWEQFDATASGISVGEVPESIEQYHRGDVQTKFESRGGSVTRSTQIRPLYDSRSSCGRNGLISGHSGGVWFPAEKASDPIRALPALLMAVA